jgi:hypothetical protein
MVDFSEPEAGEVTRSLADEAVAPALLLLTSNKAIVEALARSCLSIFPTSLVFAQN